MAAMAKAAEQAGPARFAPTGRTTSPPSGRRRACPSSASSSASWRACRSTSRQPSLTRGRWRRRGRTSLRWTRRRASWGGERLADLVGAIRSRLGRPVFADVSTVEEGLAAEALGCDYVATTLAGYTGGAPVARGAGPDFALLEGARGALPRTGRGGGPLRHAGSRLPRAGPRRACGGGGHDDHQPRDITRRFADALRRPC